MARSEPHKLSGTTQGSVTRPLGDPEEELAQASLELTRAESRLARHLVRPGGPHPHTYRWLYIARRRVAAAEFRSHVAAGSIAEARRVPSARFGRVLDSIRGLCARSGLP